MVFASPAGPETGNDARDIGLSTSLVRMSDAYPVGGQAL